MGSCGEPGLCPPAVHIGAWMDFAGKRVLAAAETRGRSAAPFSRPFENMPWSECQADRRYRPDECFAN